MTNKAIYTKNLTDPYVAGISGYAASESDTTTPVLQLTDLQGNIVARAAVSETATKLLGTERTTEYGVPSTNKPEKYSWQGGVQRATELPSGIVAMGARSYVPEIGRFLQTDQLEGGSANAYAYTYGDPVNASDPTGEFTEGLSEEDMTAGQYSAEKEIAEERAVREEAERKAASACPVTSACAAPDAGGVGQFSFTFGYGGSNAKIAKSGLEAMQHGAEVGACLIMQYDISPGDKRNYFYKDKRAYAHCLYMYRHYGTNVGKIMKDSGKLSLSLSTKDLGCVAIGLGAAAATDGSSLLVNLVVGGTVGLGCSAVHQS